MLTICCFLGGLYTFFKGNYFWIKKKNQNNTTKKSVFWVLSPEGRRNPLPYPRLPFYWKNTMTGQFPAEPWISFLLWATITKHNLWKRAFFWGKKRAKPEPNMLGCSRHRRWQSETTPCTTPLIWFSHHLPSHPKQPLAQPIPAKDKAALTWSEPPTSLYL